MEELIFGLIGGTALLMYGVDMMGDGLEKASGDTMQKVLKVLTGNVWSAFLVGTLVTAIVQSSTAVTVLTVGFVNSGLMKLPQAIGIIYGANIGTTLTTQLMAFSFKFKLTDIALPVLGIGFALNSIVKNKKVKNIGQAMMGFGMMFLGLKILNDGIPMLEQSQGLKNFFATYGTNPIIGVLLGAVVTALVHSSAATIGLVMILSQAGLLGLDAAIFIMLGDNIGTCVTAQLASMTGNINARRTAWAHTLYNVFGVVLALLFKPFFMWVIVGLTDRMHADPNISMYIANSHTLFNVLSAVIFLPLTNYYVRFLERVIKPKDNRKEKKNVLDELLIDTPIIAIEAAKTELIRGVGLVEKMLDLMMTMVYEKKRDRLGEVSDIENEINIMQKDLTRYIVKVASKELTEEESVMVPAVITSVNNIEKAGDRVIEIGGLLEKKIDQELLFTETAINELKSLEDKVLEMCHICIETIGKDFENTPKIRTLENEVDALSEELQENYIKRLNEGKTNVDSGVLFVDMVTHMERIADYIYKTTLFAKDELVGQKRKYKEESF